MYKVVEQIIIIIIAITLGQDIHHSTLRVPNVDVKILEPDINDNVVLPGQLPDTAETPPHPPTQSPGNSTTTATASAPPRPLVEPLSSGVAGTTRSHR